MQSRQKQVLAILLMLALCFTTAPVAMAMNGTPHQGQGGGGMGSGNGPGGGMGTPTHFAARGVVTVAPSTDPAAAPAMTVNIQRANRALRDFIGQDFDFTISESVVVMVVGLGHGGLDDVLQDDTVKVMGNVVDNGDGTFTYEITRVKVF